MKDKHLCNECQFEFATCRAKKILFGNGKGNDNVIRCDSFQDHPDILGWVCDDELTESRNLANNWIYNGHKVIKLRINKLRRLQKAIEITISDFMQENKDVTL
jgi:hypothetical protein